MDVKELIDFLERRFANLSAQVNSAQMLGDIERVTTLEKELSSIQITIDQLKTL